MNPLAHKLSELHRRSAIIFLCSTFISICSSCGGPTEQTQEGGSIDAEKVIAVVKFASHPALDELEDGFRAAITPLLISGDGDAFRLEYMNCDGSIESANSICETLAQRKEVVAILTIATPATIAARYNVSNKPVIYAAVADPAGSKILPSANITGIQNAGPAIIERAVDVITAIKPDAEIGTIYNSTEPNSVYVQDLLKSICARRGLRLEQISADNLERISSATEHLCGTVDVLYSANDNTVNQALSTVSAICVSHRVPFIIGDLSSIKSGPAIAVGLEYHDLGKRAAVLVHKIAVLGESVAENPPQSAPPALVWFSEANANDVDLRLTQPLHLHVDSLLR